MARLSVFIIACLTAFACNAQSVKVPKSKSCDNPGVACAIKIINPTCAGALCTADVDADEVRFKNGKNNFKVTWTLPAGFGFCDTAGDGAFLVKPDPNGQFEDPRASDPVTGPNPPACRFREFQLKAKNTKSLPNDPYLYKIIFHDAAGTQAYVVDPSMVNE